MNFAGGIRKQVSPSFGFSGVSPRAGSASVADLVRMVTSPGGRQRRLISLCLGRTRKFRGHGNRFDRRLGCRSSGRQLPGNCPGQFVEPGVWLSPRPANQVGRLDPPELQRNHDFSSSTAIRIPLPCPSSASVLTHRDRTDFRDHRTRTNRASSNAASITSSHVSLSSIVGGHQTSPAFPARAQPTRPVPILLGVAQKNVMRHPVLRPRFYRNLRPSLNGCGSQ